MKKNKDDTQKIPILKPEDYRNRDNSKHIQPTKKRQENKQVILKHNIRKAFFSFLLTVTILFFTIFIGLYSICSRTNFEPIQNSISINTKNHTNQVYNILLIGTDIEENGNSRSDSMIMISVNQKSDTINLISFMRDLWVNIPDNDCGRLNAAYTIGGAELLISTIESNFDVEIDNYVLVDFEMFKQLIDELEGITVDITEKEAEFINRTTKASVKAGTNNLDGNDALIYCRIRKLDSDFMRTHRQRKVITAIINKVKNQNIIKTATTGINILPLITTDISPLKMIIKSTSLINAVSYDINQLRIPAEKTYSNKTIKSQAVLVSDFEKNKEIIHNFIYN